MASFDIIDATGNAYQTAWNERRFFVRLAALPMFLNFVLLSGLVFFGIEENLVRRALLMLPAYLAEGWLAANVVRFVFLGERWFPPVPGGGVQGAASIAERSRGIKASAIMYTLIKYLQTGAMGLVISQEGTGETTPPQEVGDAELFAALILFGLAIYAFRFLWVYIPLALNIPVQKIIQLLRGAGISFYLLGTWLLCFVPPLMVLGGLTGALLGPYGEDAATMPLATKVLVMLLQVVFETLIALISTLAIAYGFRQMMAGKEPE